MENSEKEQCKRNRDETRSPINTRGQTSMLSLWQEQTSMNANFSRDVNSAFSYIGDNINHRLPCEISTIVNNYRSGNFCKDVYNSHQSFSGGSKVAPATEGVRVELDGLSPSKWVFETPKYKRLVIRDSTPHTYSKFHIAMLDFSNCSSDGLSEISSVKCSITKDKAHQPGEQE